MAIGKVGMDNRVFTILIFRGRYLDRIVDPVRVRFLVGGLFLVGLALFNFVTYTNTSSTQSTFNILSGQYEYLATTRSPGDSISGAFQEGSGSPVSFYILSSAQFASDRKSTRLNSSHVSISYAVFC